MNLARLGKYNEALIYLSNLYIAGDFIPQDLEESHHILDEIEDKNDASRLFFLGLIELNEKTIKKLFNYFKILQNLEKQKLCFIVVKC